MQFSLGDKTQFMVVILEILDFLDYKPSHLLKWDSPSNYSGCLRGYIRKHRCHMHMFNFKGDMASQSQNNYIKLHGKF